MPVRPGINISIRDVPPPRQAPSGTGVWFVTGISEKGPNDKAQLVTSLSEFSDYFGARVSYGILYDALDIFFREGGSVAYVTRVVGPASVKASFTLQDSVPANTLKIEAVNPGAWGNTLNVQVVAGSVGGTFVLVISDDNLGELERSWDLADKSAAINWLLYSKYVRGIDQAGTGNPAVGVVQSLTGGADDRANITDTQWTNSLNNFTRDLGPGQVSMPGRTVSAARSSLIAHAAANNRVAILDATNINVKATLLTEVQGLYSTTSKWSAIFGPWLTYPGVTSGTFRTIPPCAFVCGAISRADALGGSPNTPAAGINGTSLYATDLSISQLIDTDRDDLNDAGYNAIIKKYGSVRIYGWRSLASPSNEPGWANFGNARLIMEIAAKADALAENYLFSEIDGQGITISSFGAGLVGILMPYYSQGSIYGDTANDAFRVDVGPSVNTPTTIANRELHAVISLRPSPFAEMVVIEIVKVLVDQRLT